MGSGTARGGRLSCKEENRSVRFRLSPPAVKEKTLKSILRCKIVIVYRRVTQVRTLA